MSKLFLFGIVSLVDLDLYPLKQDNDMPNLTLCHDLAHYLHLHPHFQAIYLFSQKFKIAHSI